MIGFWGFLEELSGPVFTFLLLVVVILALRRSYSKGSGGYSIKGCIAMLVLVGLPLVASWGFVRELRAHLFLNSLSAEDVESFTIGTQQITEPEKKFILVRALRDSEWFSPHHDGWAQPINFELKLKSGEKRYFRLANYLREPGVVIDLAAPHGRGFQAHSGDAFNRSLLNALGELGITLPREPQ